MASPPIDLTAALGAHPRSVRSPLGFPRRGRAGEEAIGSTDTVGSQCHPPSMDDGGRCGSGRYHRPAKYAPSVDDQDGLSVQVAATDGEVVIVVAGEIDPVSGPMLETTMAEVLADPDLPVLVAL